MPEFGTSDDVVLLIAAFAAVVVLVAGIRERRRHRANIARLPLRISINGSRGKSTVTRLLTGALAAAGYRPFGKTTGTEARLILGWSGEELDIHRRPEGPNIGEQRDVMAQAVREGADVMVSECMAVNPEYQGTFHRELLDANVLVITNALDDHLDEMGPTQEDVADVFASTFPKNGIVAVTPSNHLARFEAAADEHESKLLVANPDEIDELELAEFAHLVLPQHVALTLAITRHLGIEDNVALRGMIDAPADPFATRLLPIGDPSDPALFVNAFPANDPVSTIGVFDHVRTLGYPETGMTVIMNCRDDRISRTQLFATDVLPHLPIHTLIVTGSATRPVLRAVRDGQIAVTRVHDLTGASATDVVKALGDTPRHNVVMGVGNLHGGGVEIVAELEQLAPSHLVRGVA